MSPLTSSYQLIYAVVRRIPKGRVATYGQVAKLAGLPRQARLVGYALNNLPANSRVPWQRVINAQGKVSLRSTSTDGDSEYNNQQQGLLEHEGVRFNQRGVIDLEVYRWRPTLQ